MEQDDAPQGPIEMPVDDYLRFRSFLANDINFTTPITLFVGGGIITGTIIGYDEYQAKMRELLDMQISGFPEESRAVVNLHFDAFLKAVNRNQPDKITMRDIHFIHLRDAFVVSQSGAIPTSFDQGMLWRGPLSAVSGFAIGKLVVARNAN